MSATNVRGLHKSTVLMLAGWNFCLWSLLTVNWTVITSWSPKSKRNSPCQNSHFMYLDFILGIPEKGPSSRHLLPVVAVPWPPVPPWIESSGPLHLCFPFAQRRSLCQSVSLHKDRPTYSATSTRTYKLEEQQRSKLPLAVKNEMDWLGVIRNECSLNHYRFPWSLQTCHPLRTWPAWSPTTQPFPWPKPHPPGTWRTKTNRSARPAPASHLRVAMAEGRVDPMVWETTLHPWVIKHRIQHALRPRRTTLWSPWRRSRCPTTSRPFGVLFPITNSTHE